MLSGVPGRVDIRRGAGHGDNVARLETVTLDMQARLVIDERVDIELERRALCAVLGRHLVGCRVRRNLDCGARRRHVGGELRRELYHVARLDVARLRGSM